MRGQLTSDVDLRATSEGATSGQSPVTGWSAGAPPVDKRKIIRTRPRSTRQRKGSDSEHPPEETAVDVAKTKRIVYLDNLREHFRSDDILTTGTDIVVKRKRIKRQRNNFVRKK